MPAAAGVMKARAAGCRLAMDIWRGCCRLHCAVTGLVEWGSRLEAILVVAAATAVVAARCSVSTGVWACALQAAIKLRPAHAMP